MSKSKSPQESRNLPYTLTNLNNIEGPYPRLWEVFRMLQLQLVSQLLSWSSLFFTAHFSFSLIFTPGSNGTVKYTRWQVFCFSLIINQSCILAGIQWPVCISKSQIILCVLFSRTDSDLYIYHLVVWSNCNVVHNSQWIIFPPSHVYSYTPFALGG